MEKIAAELFISGIQENNYQKPELIFFVSTSCIQIGALRCYQLDEGFECSLLQPPNFAKVDRQDSIGPGLNWFLQSET